MKILLDLSFDKPSFLIIAYILPLAIIGKEGMQSSGLSLACLLPVAC